MGRKGWDYCLKDGNGQRSFGERKGRLPALDSLGQGSSSNTFEEMAFKRIPLADEDTRNNNRCGDRLASGRQKPTRNSQREASTEPSSSEAIEEMSMSTLAASSKPDVSVSESDPFASRDYLLNFYVWLD